MRGGRSPWVGAGGRRVSRRGGGRHGRVSDERRETRHSPGPVPGPKGRKGHERETRSERSERVSCLSSCLYSSPSIHRSPTGPAGAEWMEVVRRVTRDTTRGRLRTGHGSERSEVERTGVTDRGTRLTLSLSPRLPRLSHSYPPSRRAVSRHPEGPLRGGHGPDE